MHTQTTARSQYRIVHKFEESRRTKQKKKKKMFAYSLDG